MEKKFLKIEETGRDCSKAKTFLKCCSLKKVYLKEELNKTAGERKKRENKTKKKRRSHRSTKKKNKGRC